MTNLEWIEENNPRSLDLYTGEQVQAYLSGDIPKGELIENLYDRAYELEDVIEAIRDLIPRLVSCPDVIGLED